MNLELWDQRIARWMIRPLANTSVTPNHLTTVRLVVGLAAVAGFTLGDATWSNWAALGLAFSNFLDHTDGELARLTGKTTPWGHKYDLFCDGFIHALLFPCIGYGLRDGGLGVWAVLMGIVAGVSVGAIFWIRYKIEENEGKAAVALPSFAGFDPEDVLYFLPLVTWFGWLPHFLVLAVAVSPVVAVGIAWVYKKRRVRE